MTPNEFTCWLANSESVTVIFEACGTSNYWKQLASSFGHDALAIIQASLLPDIAFISGETIEQQHLQSVMRLRELGDRQKTAAKNQLIALLSEFNIKMFQKNGGLRGSIESTLEDAKNGFSGEFRMALSVAWELSQNIIFESEDEGFDDKFFHFAFFLYRVFETTR